MRIEVNKNYPDTLKIEFRALPYANKLHVLEWRVSPDQNLNYTKIIYLFGIFKIKLKKKYDTKWKRPELFQCFLTSPYYEVDNNFHYIPILLRTREEFEDYKRDFQTVVSFLNYVEKRINGEYEKYRIEREKYLSKRGTWF